MRSSWLDADRERTVDLAALGPGRYRVTVDEGGFEVTVESRLRLVTDSGVTMAQVTAAGARRFVRLGHADFVIERAAGTRAARGGRSPQARLESPMPGVVTKVLVAVGDAVEKGQPLLAVEAMKMEHLIRAPRWGGNVSALRPIDGAPSSRAALLVVGVVLAVAMAWALRNIVMLVAFSVLLATALDPLVGALARVPLPRGARLPRAAPLPWSPRRHSTTGGTTRTGST